MISGPALKYDDADDVNTDVLAPGAYIKGPLEELAKHCLESIDPGFAPGARPGDVVVGGENFGMGSSREQAAIALKMLGVSAVLAKSFAGIFYRNAFNLGLPAVVCADTDRINAGDELELVSLPSLAYFAPECNEMLNCSIVRQELTMCLNTSIIFVLLGTFLLSPRAKSGHAPSCLNFDIRPRHLRHRQASYKQTAHTH